MGNDAYTVLLKKYYNDVVLYASYVESLKNTALNFNQHVPDTQCSRSVVFLQNLATFMCVAAGLVGYHVACKLHE